MTLADHSRQTLFMQQTILCREISYLLDVTNQMQFIQCYCI